MSSFVRMVVVNDNVGRPGLLNEWGWSIYIEAHGYKVLFDADTSPSVIEYNVEKLGIDLSRLDFAVLSHHHADHYGGFPAVAKAKPGLTVYVPPGGATWASSLSLNLAIVREPYRPVEGFQLSGPLTAYGLYEQALGVIVGDYVIVIVGCSHPGADRLAARIAELTGRKVLAVIGGYHDPPVSVLENLAKLSKYICPAHCSGEHAKRYVKSRYPEKYCEVRTGSIIEASGDGILTVKT